VVADPPPSPPPPAEPAAPMAETRTGLDMAGALGFGVGLIPSTQIVGTSGQVAIKYWINNAMAIVPALNFRVDKAMDTDAQWAANPEVVLLFAPYAAKTTRFLRGGGLGADMDKMPPADVRFRLYLPVQAGAEHFFARWFSLGIAARMILFDYETQSDIWSMSIAINSAQLLGSLFFYTD
jgi:hypothetical protein